jgi:hypothetical protein
VEQLKRTDDLAVASVSNWLSLKRRQLRVPEAIPEHYPSHVEAVVAELSQSRGRGEAIKMFQFRNFNL